jgi:menaquinone-dependent protoporphyrinogen oxidase
MAGHRPHILVVVESRHGATREIAGALAQRLVAAGLSVTVAAPDECEVIDADVVVIGSAVYFGKWLKPALRFIDDHAAELANRPVWLFSSGPLDDDPHSPEGIDDDYAAELTARAQADAHHIFPGRLDRTGLGPIEKLIASSVDAPEGDFRDWSNVRSWADEIAATVAVAGEQ